MSAAHGAHDKYQVWWERLSEVFCLFVQYRQCAVAQLCTLCHLPGELSHETSLSPINAARLHWRIANCSQHQLNINSSTNT